MKLYVPQIGDKLKLEKDWTFSLYREHRNSGLWKHFFDEELSYRHMPKEEKREVTLLKGTVLTVDRIYIRQGATEYSSISFYANVAESGKGAFGKPKNPRFWAKLEDCNKIEFEVVEEAPKFSLKFDAYEPYHVDSYGVTEPGTQKCTSEGEVYKCFSARDRHPVFKTKTEYTVDYKYVEYGSGLWKKKYISGEIQRGTVKFSLYDLEGNLLGEWKSLASLKKKAKELLNS